MKQRIGEHTATALLALIVFYLLILQVWAVWPFTIDDMYITLRYAKNWSDGFGLLWNVGEPPVEGYSNFSFVVIARFALSCGVNPVVVLKSVGVIGLFFTCLAVYGIARLWGSARFALIPCLWLLAYKGQIIWSVSGLETAFYQALITSSTFFILSGLGYSCYPRMTGSLRPGYFFMAGVLLALAGMTRPEAPVFMMLFLVLLWIGRSQPPRQLYWRSMVLFCSALFLFYVPYFLGRWHYYGHLFPNPVYCKGLADFAMFNLDKQYLYLIGPFFLLALPVFFTSRKGDMRPYFLALPSLIYLILLMDSDPVVAFDNRLFLPAFSLMLPLAVHGMCIYLKKYVDGTCAFLYLAALGVLVFFIPTLSLSGYRHFTENPIAGERLRQDVALWLQQKIPHNASVVLADSGLIPYRSKQRFVDSYCLNNAEMTKKTTTSMYQHFCDNVMQTKPDVIILSALIEDGKVIYTPADVCMAVKLAHNRDYCLQRTLSTGDGHSIYRYEIFKGC